VESGVGTSVTFTPTNTGIGLVTFNASASDAPPCPPCAPKTVSLDYTVIKVASIEPDPMANLQEIDDGDGNPKTRVFVVPVDEDNNPPVLPVTVKAKITPDLSESVLPNSFSLHGGSGAAKLTRTVSRLSSAGASKTVFTFDCGGLDSGLNTTVYVFKVEPQWGAIDEFNITHGSLPGSGDGLFTTGSGGINPSRFSVYVSAYCKHFVERGYGHQFWLKVTPDDTPVTSVDMTIKISSLLSGALNNSGPTPYASLKATWGVSEYTFPANQLPQRVELFSEQLSFCDNGGAGTVNLNSSKSLSRGQRLKVGQNNSGQFNPFTDRYVIWQKVRGEVFSSSYVPLDSAEVDVLSGSFGGYITDKNVAGCSNPQ